MSAGKDTGSITVSGPGVERSCNGQVTLGGALSAAQGHAVDAAETHVGNLSDEALRRIVEDARAAGPTFRWTMREKDAWTELRRRESWPEDHGRGDGPGADGLEL